MLTITTRTIQNDNFMFNLPVFSQLKFFLKTPDVNDSSKKISNEMMMLNTHKAWAKGINDVRENIRKNKHGPNSGDFLTRKKMEITDCEKIIIQKLILIFKMGLKPIKRFEQIINNTKENKFFNKIFTPMIT